MRFDRVVLPCGPFHHPVKVIHVQQPFKRVDVRVTIAQSTRADTFWETPRAVVLIEEELLAINFDWFLAIFCQSVTSYGATVSGQFALYQVSVRLL